MKDRNDENEANVIINEKIPDLAMRQMILTILSDAIIEANQDGDDQWAVTVSSTNDIRFVIGHYIAITLYSEGLWLALEKQQYDSMLQLRQNDFSLFKNFWEPDLIDVKGSYPSYKNMDKEPFSINGYFNLKNACPDSIPILRSLLFVFIQSAIDSGQPIMPQTKAAHSPGIIKYLRNELKREIPDPNY